MIRVQIKWETHFKLFRRVSGTLIVENVQINEGQQTVIEKLITSEIYGEDGVLGYQNINFRSKRYAKYFEKIKPLIDLAIRSYLEGMKMHNSSVFWCEKRQKIDPKDNTSVITF